MTPLPQRTPKIAQSNLSQRFNFRSLVSRASRKWSAAQTLLILLSIGALPHSLAMAQDTTPPGQVNNLEVWITSPNSVIYKWNAVNDDDGTLAYIVQTCRGAGCSNWVERTESKSCAWYFTPPCSSQFGLPGESRTYRVIAVDGAGNRGQPSSAVTVQLPMTDSVPPPTPTQVTAHAPNATSIELHWNTSKDNLLTEKYEIERCAGEGCTDFSLSDTHSFWAGDNWKYYNHAQQRGGLGGLSPSTTYRIRMSAVDFSGNRSPYSSIVTATTPEVDTQPPAAPTSIETMLLEYNFYTLRWQPSQENNYIHYYEIHECEGVDCTDFEPSQIILAWPNEVEPATLASYFNRQELTTYRYRIRAADATYNVGPWSEIFTVTTPISPDLYPPSAIGTLSSTASPYQINLTWNPATDNRGVTNYLIERCVGYACANFQQIAATNSTQFVDSNLNPKRIYRYRIRAIDDWGLMGPYSPVLQVATPAPQATPPTNPIATTYYTYDELGRLSQASRTDGSVIIYSYDQNGNATQIYRASATTLGVARLQPATGIIGTTVTILGSGFSTTASANTVRFNGITAVVSNATSTTLTVTVPAGATTGLVSVSNGTSTGQSSSAFVVKVPVISSFTPTVVNAGGTVTIDGTDFDLSTQPESVSIGSVNATIQSLTNTRAIVTIPSNALTGMLTLQTGYGTTTSSSPLVVAPAGITPSSVQQTGAVVIGQAPRTLVTTQSSSYALAYFNADIGDYLTADLNTLSTTPANSSVSYTLYSPTNAVAYSGTFTSTIRSAHLPKITAAGTYLLVLRNYSGGLQTDVSISRSTELQSTGTPLAIATSFPAQGKRFTFTGTAGQNLGIALASAVLSPTGGSVTVQVNKPDNTSFGSVFCSSTTTPGCQLSLRNLPTTGIYNVTVTPSSAATMTGNLTLSQSVSATLTPNTPQAVNLASAGQTAVLTFTATAGQTFALNAASIVTTPASKTVTVTVFNASGTQVGTASSTTGNVTTNLTNLAAGTYSVLITSSDASTAAMQVTLASGLVATLNANGSAAAFATTVKGQNGYFTFSATAGQSFGLALTNLTTLPTGGSAQVQVNKPDGSSLAVTNCYTTTLPGCQLNLRNVPTAGTYTVVVSPNTAATLNFSLTLSQTIANTLTVNTPLSLNFAAAGQNGLLSFTATAGQTFALAVTSIASTPASKATYITVFNSGGTQIGTANGTGSSVTVNLPNLAAGTYSALITSSDAATATMQVTLASGLTGTLPANGTTNSFASTVPAQVGYFTFAGTAGQSFGLGVTNLTMTPSSVTIATIYVDKPDGSLLTSLSCSTSNAPGCQLSLRNLPTTGTYTVRVQPSGAATMSVALTLSANVTGALTFGTPLDVNLSVPGQNALLTFTVTTTQTVALNLLAVTTTPTGKTVTASVFNPSGTQIGTTNATTSSTLNLTSLAAGTYSILIAPQFAATATLQVRVQ